MKSILLLPLLLFGFLLQDYAILQEPVELPACQDIEGEDVDWGGFGKRAVVLYFHNPELQYSREGLAEVIDRLSVDGAARREAALVIVGMGGGSLEEAANAHEASKLRGAIVQDPERALFQAFGVKAFPTVHVLNPELERVFIAKGFGPHLAFRVQAGVRFAAGKIDREKFDAILKGGAPDKVDPEVAELHRRANLARKLALKGKDELALKDLLEAMADKEIEPVSTELAIRLQLRLGQVESATERLMAFAAAFPDLDSVDLLRCRAALAQGDLATAEAALKGKRARLLPEVNLLKGRILAAQGRWQEAAELLVEDLENRALEGAL